MVVTLITQATPNDGLGLTVLPITHRQRDNPDWAVEIPPAVKRHLGLDDDRSWIVVAEGNAFMWPGYDFRKAPGGDRYDYGFLPPRLFKQVLMAFKRLHGTGKTRLDAQRLRARRRRAEGATLTNLAQSDNVGGAIM